MGIPVELVTVKASELKRLQERDQELTRLEANGVDNWEGYSLAFQEEDEDGA